MQHLSLMRVPIDASGSVDRMTVGRPFISELRIQVRIAELARRIAEDYRGRELLVIGVLKGSFVFLADLTRALGELQLSLQVDFIRLSSYGSGTAPGELKLVSEPVLPLKDSAVLIVDDIIDSGWTLSFAQKYALAAGAASVKTCALLDKPDRRKVDFNVDYCGFVIPDLFVVGYGLDYNENYRHLPFIKILDADGADK